MKHFDDLTKIDVRFTELDKDTQDRLFNSPHIEIKDCDDKWYRIENPIFLSLNIYRKQNPITMTRQQVLERFNVLVTEEKE
jgi:hypothetical protein